jgi:hypothetical protein
MKKNYKKNTYPEVVRYFSLDGPVASMRSEPIMLSSSHELTMTVPGRCHHPRVVETNQVTQHLVD